MKFARALAYLCSIVALVAVACVALASCTDDDLSRLMIWHPYMIGGHFI